jgi:hypothetical protein
LLLCGAPEENLEKELGKVQRYGTNGETTGHPNPQYKDFKPYYDILQSAIENRQIPCLGGKTKDTNVKSIPKNSRKITRADLKKWIIESGPPELPKSLFSEAERNVYMARSPEAFEILSQKYLDEKKARENAEMEMERALLQLKKCKARLEQLSPFSQEDKKTNLIIIGALIEIGNVYQGDVFSSL